MTEQQLVAMEQWLANLHQGTNVAPLGWFAEFVTEVRCLRALVGELAWALQLRDDHACLPTEAFEVKYGQYCDGDVEDELAQALARAQAALDGAPGEG